MFSRKGAQAQAGGTGGSGGRSSGHHWAEREREPCQPTSHWIDLLKGTDCHLLPFLDVTWAILVPETLGWGARTSDAHPRAYHGAPCITVTQQGLSSTALGPYFWGQLLKSSETSYGITWLLSHGITRLPSRLSPPPVSDLGRQSGPIMPASKPLGVKSQSF